MFRSVSLAALCLAFSYGTQGQDFDFPQSALTDPAVLSTAMPDLARQVMAVYKENDREKYLDNLFRLQMVAAQYPEALSTIAALREVLRTASPPRGAWVNKQYEIYAHAKIEQSAG